MSQHTDTSPSASVNWREPTTEEKIGYFSSSHAELVSMCQLGWQPLLGNWYDGHRRRGYFVVCLYLGSGKVDAYWLRYLQPPIPGLDEWDLTGKEELKRSVALKLGYTLNGRSWDSLEEAQNALTQEIQRGRVLAVEAEREEQMEPALRAKAEAEAQARYDEEARRLEGFWGKVLMVIVVGGLVLLVLYVAYMIIGGLLYCTFIDPSACSSEPGCRGDIC